MKVLLRIVLIIVSVIVIWEVFFHVNLHGEIEDSEIWTDTIPKEYSQLLKLPDSCCKTGKIVFVNTLSSKYRNPVSRFFIDGKYYLQVYKIDNSFKSSLEKSIKESFSGSVASYTEYADDDITDMKFLYKRTKPHKPNAVYFALAGDSTRVLKKNDTIAYYSSKCANLSIRFDPDQENDIYGECKSRNLNQVPLELMFLRRTSNLYMFVLSSKEAATSLKQGTLSNLLF
jgi:hypothetical protein